MESSFQRVGESSNAALGAGFELLAQSVFSRAGIHLSLCFSLPVGIHEQKKQHRFDLGSEEEKIIVECKSHTWTAGKNIPSAKLTVWNEAMFYFHIAPIEYRGVLFVIRDYSESHSQSLAEYYVRIYSHMIPDRVQIAEYDPTIDDIRLVRTR
jgi:hypothetical protein